MKSTAEIAKLEELSALPPEDLIKEVERYGFECAGGPLHNALVWVEIKRRIRVEGEQHTWGIK